MHKIKHSRLHSDQQVLINAAGMGSGLLANDPAVYPIRGMLIKVCSLPE